MQEITNVWWVTPGFITLLLLQVESIFVKKVISSVVTVRMKACGHCLRVEWFKSGLLDSSVSSSSLISASSCFAAASEPYSWPSCDTLLWLILALLELGVPEGNWLGFASYCSATSMWAWRRGSPKQFTSFLCQGKEDTAECLPLNSLSKKMSSAWHSWGCRWLWAPKQGPGLSKPCAQE